MTTKFPASGDQVFPSFREAYLWADASEVTDFEGPDVNLNENHRYSKMHRYTARRFFWAVQKAIQEGGSLMAIPNEDWRQNVSVLTYDKQKDWLIAFQSQNKFEKVTYRDMNYGLKVAKEPVQSMLTCLGEIPEEPASYDDTQNWDVSKWYDNEGDFLYGDDTNDLKTTLKFFLDNLGPSPNIFFIKVNLPTDTTIQTINWFFKAFSPR